MLAFYILLVLQLTENSRRKSFSTQPGFIDCLLNELSDPGHTGRAVSPRRRATKCQESYVEKKKKPHIPQAFKIPTLGEHTEGVFFFTVSIFSSRKVARP